MDENPNDVTNPASSPGTDANADPSPAKPQSTSADTEKSLQDIVLKVAEERAGVPIDDKTGAAKAPSGSKVEPDQKHAEGVDEGKEVPSPDKVELPPFHTHPRWQEKVKEVNQYRDEVDKLRPLAEAQESIVTYLQDAGVSPAEFQNAMEIAALLKVDPAAALEKLKPLVEGLGYGGESLPKDLQDRVEEGHIRLEDAKEIAQLRTQMKMSDVRGQTAQQLRAETEQRGRLNALSAWEQTTSDHDPDYKQKAKEDEPDGIYELTAMKFKQLIDQRPPRTNQQITALAQQAYDSAKRTLTKARGLPKATAKTLSSQSTSGTGSVEEPKSVRDVVFQTAAKHGL